MLAIFPGMILSLARLATSLPGPLIWRFLVCTGDPGYCSLGCHVSKSRRYSAFLLTSVILRTEPTRHLGQPQIHNRRCFRHGNSTRRDSCYLLRMLNSFCLEAVTKLESSSTFLHQAGKRIRIRVRRKHPTTRTRSLNSSCRSISSGSPCISYIP